MKGYEHKNLETSSNTGEDAMKIGIADTGFIFDILFNQMYRDPIGSVIREITSNCFDSHIEAGVDDAVVINFGEDEGGDYITFTDVGVGLSADRIDKIYKNAGTSSKRDRDDLIGHFGLGSKSPLAYDESFFLTTIFDKVKYEYLVHRGSGSSPEIQPLLVSETEERNGTEVKIYIKNSRDKREFQDKLTYQLRYFDNVFVNNCPSFNNHYKVHEEKNFKLRPDLNSSEELHIAIGKVTYPIDWSKLKNKRIDLPFALKFSIGELPITPERESIRYINVEQKDGTFISSSEIIDNKINALLEELKELRGEELVEHNNLIDWYEGDNSSNVLTIAGKNFSLRGIINKVQHVYTPLKELGLNTVLEYPFLNHCVTRKVNHQEVYKAYGQITVPDLTDCLFVREFTTINKLKSINVDYLRTLAKEEGKKSVYFIGKQNTYLSNIKTLLKKKPIHKIEFGVNNRVTLYKQYKAIMERELITNSIDYYTLQIPDDFKTKWEALNKLKTTKVEAEDGEVVVDDMRTNVSSSKKVLKLKNIPLFDGFILYGYATDEVLLKRYATLFQFGSFINTSSILKIKVKDEKHFIGLKNTIYVKSFMSNNPIFRKIATAAVVNKSSVWNNAFLQERSASYNSLNRIKVEDLDFFNFVFTPLDAKLKKLKKIKNNTVNLTSTEATTVEFVDEIVKMAESNNWIEDETKQDLLKVENYFKGIELINHIVLSEASHNLIVDFLKLANKPVNAEWRALDTWQEELIKESQAKFEYVSGLFYTDSSFMDYGKRKEGVNRLDKLKSRLHNNFKELTVLTNYHGNKERVY